MVMAEEYGHRLVVHGIDQVVVECFGELGERAACIA